MQKIYSLTDGIFAPLERIAPYLMPALARFIFAAVLLVYYLNSGLTKLGEGIMGIFSPSAGAYIQIFPKTMEAVGYDPSQLNLFHWAVTIAGTWAEFILPIAIVLGFMTRLAALGMIGFVIVQSWVDITGHGLAAKSIGAWFDGDASSLIMDQRAFWMFVLIFLVIRGGGPFSLDALLNRPKI